MCGEKHRNNRRNFCPKQDSVGKNPAKVRIRDEEEKGNAIKFSSCSLFIALQAGVKTQERRKIEATWQTRCTLSRSTIVEAQQDNKC